MLPKKIKEAAKAHNIEVTPKNIPSNYKTDKQNTRTYDAADVDIDSIKSLRNIINSKNPPPVINVSKSHFFHTAKTHYVLPIEHLKGYKKEEKSSPYPKLYRLKGEKKAKIEYQTTENYEITSTGDIHDSYLPPKVEIALKKASNKVLSSDKHIESEKEYITPRPSSVETSKHMDSMDQPHKEYNTYMKNHMTTMKPPSKEYLPPNEAKNYASSTMAPPTKEYSPPNSIKPARPYQTKNEPMNPSNPPKTHVSSAKGIRDSLVIYSPPSKVYRPPKTLNEEMKSPHIDYLLPHQEKHDYQHMKPPQKEYIQSLHGHMNCLLFGTKNFSKLET